MFIKNVIFHGDAGLQISMNSTDDSERDLMFGGCARSVSDISKMCKRLPSPVGRKITLNFAVAGYKVDAELLKRLFDPSKFVCKLTPMHKTATAVDNGVKTEGDYTTPEPYQALAGSLKAVGFDVLTFIASEDEDLSRITCGNAILSGTMPHKYKEAECELNTSIQKGTPPLNLGVSQVTG
jgi:23S rRNA (adenine2503-C2)-methyltransferase